MLHTYVRSLGRPGPAHLLTYPQTTAGRGNTSARTHCDGTLRTCDRRRSAGRRMGCGRRRSLRNVSISCCDIAGFSVVTVPASRRVGRWSQCGRERCCASVRWSHPSTAATARALTYLPPEPSALAVRRPYLLTPSVWCRTDLGKLKKYETQDSLPAASHQM